MFERRIKSTR